jgi:hypothetical protein
MASPAEQTVVFNNLPSGDNVMKLVAMGFLCWLACQATFCNAQETAAEKTVEDKADSKPVTIEIAGGKLQLKAPSEWKQVIPKVPNLIMYEFNYPSNAKPGEATVRVTVSQSGGGVEPNLTRWYGQFTQPDGKPTKDVAKVEVLDAAGQKVHYVQLTGTYLDSVPMSPRPAVKREKYMMLGAIIETKESGLFFIKLIGPVSEKEKLEGGFVKMLKEMEAK